MIPSLRAPRLFSNRRRSFQLVLFRRFNLLSCFPFPFLIRSVGSAAQPARNFSLSVFSLFPRKGRRCLWAAPFFFPDRSPFPFSSRRGSHCSFFVRRCVLSFWRRFSPVGFLWLFRLSFSPPTQGIFFCKQGIPPSRRCLLKVRAGSEFLFFLSLLYSSLRLAPSK